MPTSDKAKINTMRQWLKRKRKHGKEPTADEIWRKIKLYWPTLEEERQEAIFQAVN
jgi:hypothetical protein